jgi:hypothetical protein
MQIWHLNPFHLTKNCKSPPPQLIPSSAHPSNPIVHGCRGLCFSIAYNTNLGEQGPPLLDYVQLLNCSGWKERRLDALLSELGLKPNQIGNFRWILLPCSCVRQTCGCVGRKWEELQEHAMHARAEFWVWRCQADKWCLLTQMNDVVERSIP